MAWEDLWGRDKGAEQTVERKWEQAPEFPEAKGARESLSGRLTEFGEQPGYGAIPSNWQDLWGQAKEKVQQYFWGSPTDPGIVGKLKSRLAGKGMGEQPAAGRTLARMGATEAGELSDIAVRQAYEEAQESEKGRRNWMADMYKMAGLKPTMLQTGGTTTETSGGGEGWDLLGELGSAAVSAAMGGGGMPAGGGGAPSGGGVYGAGGRAESDWFNKLFETEFGEAEIGGSAGGGYFDDVIDQNWGY